MFDLRVNIPYTVQIRPGASSGLHAKIPSTSHVVGNSEAHALFHMLALGRIYGTDNYDGAVTDWHQSFSISRFVILSCRLRPALGLLADKVLSINIYISTIRTREDI